MARFMVNTDMFGMYVRIPTGYSREMHIYKVVSKFKTNSYCDVPIVYGSKPVPHEKEFHDLSDLEDVINVIHCGIDETEVIRVALKDCEIVTPTADVAPKSEVDKWYYEYHYIKDALKQEKDYHRETHKLVDKYFTELQAAKSEVERLEKELAESYKKLDESTDFTCVFGQPHKVSNCPIDDEVAKAKAEVAREIFAEMESCLDYIEEQLEDIPDAFLCVKEDLATLKKKYVEGENDE